MYSMFCLVSMMTVEHCHVDSIGALNLSLDFVSDTYALGTNLCHWCSSRLNLLGFMDNIDQARNTDGRVFKRIYDEIGQSKLLISRVATFCNYAVHPSSLRSLQSNKRIFNDYRKTSRHIKTGVNFCQFSFVRIVRIGSCGKSYVPQTCEGVISSSSAAS